MGRFTSHSDLALMLSGGGARAAYQVGFLRLLAREFPDVVPGILTGVSAGGINAAYLAARQESFAEKVENLADVWSRHPYRQRVQGGPPRSRLRSVRWGGRLLGGGKYPLPPARSLVDTAPLRELLRELLTANGGDVPESPEPRRRLAPCDCADRLELHDRPVGDLGADARRLRHRRPGSGRSGRASDARLGVEHVMASSALPFFFPAIEVDGAWYGDGGIRLTAPLSPAVHLGARRIIAVSTRYARSREEADRPAIVGYPPPAQVAGVLYNAIFLDQLDGDAWRCGDQRSDRPTAGRPSARDCGPSICCCCGPRSIWDDWRTSTSQSCRARSGFSRAGSARADAVERHAQPGDVPE